MAGELEVGPGLPQDEELIPKKGTHVTSVIWKWFGFKRSNVNQTFVLCKICRKTIPEKGSSITNLFHHL